MAKVYFALGGQLELHWLGRQIGALPAETRWQSLARSALRVDLSSQARTLACDALKLTPKAKDVDAILTAWNERYRFHIDRFSHLLADVRTVASVEMPMLSVLMRELRSIG